MDVDSASTFTPDTKNGQYGTLVIDGDGKWTYTLNNAHPQVDTLSVDEHLKETFTVTTADGTPQEIVITINGGTTLRRRGTIPTRTTTRS